MASDGFCRPVERQNPPLTIGRRQAARKAVDDVLIECLQIRDLARRALESRAGALQPIGERPAEKRDREEQEDVQAGRVGDDALRRQYPFVTQKRHAKHRRQLEVLREHDADVQQRAERRNHHAATAELHAAGGGDRQHVERGEITRDAARDRDERRTQSARRRRAGNRRAS